MAVVRGGGGDALSLPVIGGGGPVEIAECFSIEHTMFLIRASLSFKAMVMCVGPVLYRCFKAMVMCVGPVLDVRRKSHGIFV